MEAQKSEVVTGLTWKPVRLPLHQKDFQKADRDQWKKLPDVKIQVPIPAGSGSAGRWKKASEYLSRCRPL